MATFPINAGELGRFAEIDEKLNGATAKINASYGVKIAGANVVTADVEASNGVIHVIDAVILPSE